MLTLTLASNMPNMASSTSEAMSLCVHIHAVKEKILTTQINVLQHQVHISNI